MSTHDSHEKHPPKSAPVLRMAGLLAEYDTPASVYQAAKKIRDAGFEKWDVHTPFPIHGMDDAMGLAPTPLGWISLVGGLAGGSFGTWMQWWMGGIDYPLNIGGKPAFALQSSIPIIFELTILLTAFGTLFGMLGLNKLPQLYHWVFESENFKKVTDDRFFISIESEDPKFERARAALEKTHPVLIEEVSEDMTGLSTEALRENASMTFEALTGVSSPLAKAPAKSGISSDNTHLDAEVTADRKSEDKAKAEEKVDEEAAVSTPEPSTKKKEDEDE